MSVTARAARISDAAAIAAIYNEGIADRIATFETEPRTAEHIAGWFDGCHPIVVVENDDIPSARRPAFTQFNVFLRDAFVCQYCGERCPATDLTFDHLVPRSRGGRTTWENVVTACGECNLRKGSRLPRECAMFPRSCRAT